jgi:SPW repeat
MKKSDMSRTAVGWTSMALGLVIAVTPAWAQTTAVGAGFTLGLGAMTLMYGGWSLIGRDPTRDHWAMSVVGLVLAIAPWIGGYAGDGAAWVSWIGGVALMVLAGAAYIADEADAVTETERIKALAKYQAQHAISLHDTTKVRTATVDSADFDQPRELVDALPIRPRHGADY